jgi:hypothetical protein
MNMIQANDNPWPGLQLRPGVVFFWTTGSGNQTIFRGKFEEHGKVVKVAGGTDHPAARFSGVETTSDFGKTWTPVEARTFSANNQFFTNIHPVARMLVGDR